MCTAAALLLFAFGVGAANSADGPVNDLLSRLLGPERASQFTISIDASTAGAVASFQLSPTTTTTSFGTSVPGVNVRGSDPIAAATGVKHYLESINASVSWAATGGDNLAEALPPTSQGLPPIAPTSRSSTLARRYYFNTCTYGYSTVWWSWSRWERELDWMALHGINTPLSMLGTEWVWREVFTRDFGLSRAELDDFFSGPAYLPWHWMGNLDGWGGPLPDAWIERGRQLQHRFLARAREFGMTPVLPAFAGFVPGALKKRFPTIVHDAAGWGNFPPTHYVEPTSELFGKIGTAFVRRMCAQFGCNEGWFTADLYNELTPPSVEPGYLRNVSQSVYAAIAAGASETTKATPVWLAQAWMWHSRDLPFRPPWNGKAIQAFLDGPPMGGLVMLDLYAEQSPLWNETLGFFGHPWIFSTIFNFGGRSGLYGRIPHIAEAVPSAVAANKTSGFGSSMVGMGAAPEAIETDPIMYDLLFETAWMGAPLKDPTEWTRAWAARRYSTHGVAMPAGALDAWAKLGASVYGCRRPQQGPPGSILAARPNTKLPQVSCCDETDLFYNPADVVDAWRMLLDATSSPSNSTPSISASTLASKQQYLHDVADIGVQCLSNLALQVHKRSVAAVMANNATAFHETAVEFLAILDDAELLAATQEGRLLGQWIDHARTSAVTPSFARQSSSEGDAADLYELNARTIVSLWGSADSNLHEYSYRLWGGMLSTFYKPRWASWFGKVEAAIRSHTRFNETKFYEDVEQWELAWTKQTGVDLPTKPAEGALEKARAVYARHFRVQ